METYFSTLEDTLSGSSGARPDLLKRPKTIFPAENSTRIDAIERVLAQQTWKCEEIVLVFAQGS